ncbi:MAG: glycosyltransferase family 9 protein [Nitrospirae bacterium]|nr:glycosyltransferase family 9 protein [Nitrospirota bacterium]
MINIFLAYIALPFINLILSIRKRHGLNKILVIQTAKIGDMICSTPVFREIKRKYPTAHLTVFAAPSTIEIISDNPNVDEIVSIKTEEYSGLGGKLKLAALIREGHYDAAVCLNPNTLFSLALFWGLVPVRLTIFPNFCGLTFQIASYLFSGTEKHIQGRLTSETYLRMLKKIGIESIDTKKDIFINNDAASKASEILQNINKPLIGIGVSSGNKLKELGAGKFAEVVNILLDKMNANIVLVGAFDEKQTADAIIASIIRKNMVTDAVGKLKLRELPSLIARLSLFISVDTGIAYMADALGIPVIDIAGPSDMEDQRPTGDNCAIIQKNIACAPCSHSFKSPYHCALGTRECIESVSAEEIFGAAAKIIKNADCDKIAGICANLNHTR